MSTRTASSSARRGRARRGPSRREAIRRRALLLVAVVVSAVGVAAALAPWADDAVQEVVTLPLRHEDIIRQQAADKDLDPTLIAGVIFAESHFRDQTSQAGAKGLMQLMPETAEFIAQRSGGVAFEQVDLATPQVNIAYGSWYLRYLLDRYDGSPTPPRAAGRSRSPTSRTPRRAATSARCWTPARTTGASTGVSSACAERAAPTGPRLRGRPGRDARGARRS